MTPGAPIAALAGVVQAALAEDLGERGDITTQAVVPAGSRMEAVVRSREEGCIAGVDAIPIALAHFTEPAGARIETPDGTEFRAGEVIAALSGSAWTILGSERVILNLLGRLSGIATTTAAAVRAVAGTGVAIKDTRKTTPGLRILEKYAVSVGGGVNHRFGLYDAVLIKDNHVAAAGSVAGAVSRVRAQWGDTFPVQVEVDTLAQLEEALAAEVGAVLLDNMAPDMLRRAVGIAQGRCHLEASGGITLTNVRAIAETGVDSISLGWLTHSARSLDLGLDIG
jgi:nicotinate-nucleotide pyrophosphorylase (carboxylating)